MVVRIPVGDITNLHYNFVVAKPLVNNKEFNKCFFFSLDFLLVIKTSGFATTKL